MYCRALENLYRSQLLQCGIWLEKTLLECNQTSVLSDIVIIGWLVCCDFYPPGVLQVVVLDIRNLQTRLN